MSGPERVVSLLPSATEIVSILGCREQLVGRSHECDHPPGVEQLPVVSRPRVGMPELPGEIDRTIRDLVSDALGVYEVDDEVLAELAPDVVVTQDVCEVCAVPFAEVADAVRRVVGEDTEVVSLSPTTLQEVLDDHHRVAAVLGVQATADRVVAGLRRRLEEVGRRVAGRRPPTVATIEWVDPLMAAGNWVPELVELAGGTNLLGEAGSHSPWLEPDALLDADPDRVLVVPCGWDLARAQQDLEQLQTADWWGELRAVGEGGVAVADGHQYFNRPGPRIVESAEILAEWLHLEAADFGHEGTGFVRVPPSG